MTKKIYIFLLLLAAVHSGFGQSYPEYIYRSITFQGTTLPYRLFIPGNYSTGTKYPVVLALHGWGESGTDNNIQLTKTRLAVSWSEPASQAAHPCFVVVPQTNSAWDNNAVAETLAALLDALLVEFSIDPNRQYITGLSMGGQGVWYMLNKYPNRFAAAIPMCGSGNPAAITSAWNTAIWAFHGTLDETIPVAGSRDMVAALENVGRSTVYTSCKKTNCEGMLDNIIQMHIQSHADLIYTEYQFGTHRIWDTSYDNPMLHPWVFSQYRSTPGAINLTNFNNPQTVSGIQPVQWQSPAQGENVEILYSTNTGDTWAPVVTSAPDNGTYQWDTRNFNDGAFSLINIFLKNNEGFVYSRDRSAYFAIDNRATGTPFVKILNVEYPMNTNQATLPLQLLLGDSKSETLTVRLYYSPDGGQNFTQFDSYTATPDVVPVIRTRTVQLSALNDSGNAVIKVEVDNGSNVFSDRTPSFYNRTGVVNQTITFDPLAAVTYGISPFTLSATASSGLPVQFASSNTSVATINGAVITIVGAGTTSIAASQPGNANYSAAPNVAHTLAVNKGNQTITFNPLTPVSFGDQPFALTAQSSSGLSLTYTSSNTSVATVSGSTVTIAGAGTTTISAVQSGDANYNAATTANQNLTVNKVNQSITFNPLTPVSIGDQPFALTAQASSGLSLNYSSSNTSVATVSGNTVTIVGVGTATISAMQGGDANYNAATANQNLTVNKVNQTITFNPLTPVSFGDQPLVLTAQSSSGLSLSYSSSNTLVATVSGSSVTIVGAGTTTISAMQSGDANYNAATASQSLTVNKVNQTITFNPLTPVSFGDQPFLLAAQSSSGLSLNYTSSNTSVATVSGSTMTIVGAGTTTISAMQSGDANYNAATASQSLTVNMVSQTITFNPLTPVSFGNQPFVLTAQSSSGLPLNYTSSNTSVATVSGSTVTIVGAGTTTISAVQSGNSNFNAATANQNLTVNKVNQTITFNPLIPVSFGDQPIVLTAQSSSGMSLNYSSSNTSVATVSGSTVTIVGAGTTIISASQPGNTNYNGAIANQSLAVNKVNQTITFNPLTAVSFGDQPFVLTAQSSSGLSLNYISSNTSVATVSGSTVTIVGAGTTIISASQPGDINYMAAVTDQSLTVSKVNQTIAFNSLTPVSFGDQPFVLTAQSSSGLPLNYSSSNTSVAKVSGSTVTIVGAGTTIISASQPGNTNYIAAVADQGLTVGKADQTISFNPLTPVSFGAQRFALTGQSSSGLPLSYVSSNTSIATVSGNTVTILGAGTTIISAMQNGSLNYNAAAGVVRTLIVNKANQTIFFSPVSNTPLEKGMIVLLANSSSGLSLDFSSSSVAIATLSGNTATLHSAGSLTFTARQPGNENYNAAIVVTQTICVLPNKPKISVNFTNADAPELTSSSTWGNQWYRNATSIDGATNATYTAVDAGTYVVRVEQNGCESPPSDEANIVITGIEPTMARGLYPNPATHEITYSGIGNNAASFEIMDELGRSVKQLPEKEGHEITIDISTLSSGNYLLKVIQKDNMQTIRFMKK